MPLTSAEFAHFRDLRRTLHQSPELAYEEHVTAATIRGELSRLGIEFLPGPADAPTATIAWIGSSPGPCLALRADMDALPIAEASPLPYASRTPGKMHACGHDGHVAALLATAAVLARQGVPRGCVKLVFQPAEEGGAGADRLVQAGVLDGRLGPRVDAIFGLHGYPGLPLGTVSTRPGPLMASTDTLRVTIRGRGCHGAFPHHGRDPLLAAAECVVALQSIVARELDPVDAGVVTIGILRGGTAVNVIPSSAGFEGTVRALSEATRRQLREAVIRRVTHTALAAGCTAEIDYEPGYPATVNHPGPAELVAAAARSALGPERFIPCASPAMGGEDFAYYLQATPGAFFFVGLTPEHTPDPPPLHSDRFDFNDDAIPTAVTMFLTLARECLEGTGLQPSR